MYSAYKACGRDIICILIWAGRHYGLLMVSLKDHRGGWQEHLVGLVQPFSASCEWKMEQSRAHSVCMSALIVCCFSLLLRSKTDLQIVSNSRDSCVPLLLRRRRHSCAFETKSGGCGGDSYLPHCGSVCANMNGRSGRPPVGLMKKHLFVISLWALGVI